MEFNVGDTMVCITDEYPEFELGERVIISDWAYSNDVIYIRFHNKMWGYTEQAFITLKKQRSQKIEKLNNEYV